MTPFGLAWKNTWEKPLSSALSIVLTSLSAGIFLWISFGAQQIESSLKRDLDGVDLVVGAKGSPLGIILSTVYHIDNPTGNIPLGEASALAENQWVERAIPLALGDNYREFRIVGTDESYIELYNGELASGRSFQHIEEVVIGSAVAFKAGLSIGDVFEGQHGLSGETQAHEGHPFTVVGILKPTGTALDKLVLTPLPTVWAVHDHSAKGSESHGDDHGNEHEHENHHDHGHSGSHDHSGHDHSQPYYFSWDTQDSTREITAMIISYTGPMATFQLPRYINTQTSMQAAMPAIEVNRLLGLLQGFVKLITTLAWVIVAVSALSIFIGLYHQLQQRKAALALLRVQGASRWTLFWVLTWEGITLALCGGIGGWIISRMGLFGMNSWFESSYQQGISVPLFTTTDAYVLLGCIILGLLSAAPSSIKAFTLNLSKTLHDA